MAVATSVLRQAGRTVAERATRSRAVHIKISPRTHNIHESREILKVLKSFGNVLWYQNLRYDRTNPAPNTLICIYEHADSANELIRESPMRFTVPPPRSITEPVVSFVSMGIMDAFKSPHEPPAATSTTHGQESTSNKAAADNNTEKEFVLSADISLTDHEAALQQNEYSWGFRMHMRNQAQAALARQVPEQGMAVLTPEQRTVPARIVKQEARKVDKFVEDLERRLVR